MGILRKFIVPDIGILNKPHQKEEYHFLLPTQGNEKQDGSFADSEEFKYYDFINAETAYDFEEYLNNIKNLSLYYDEENAPSFGDEIITLSTCDYYTTDGRFAVLAKRIK